MIQKLCARSGRLIPRKDSTDFITNFVKDSNFLLIKHGEIRDSQLQFNFLFYFFFLSDQTEEN